jgi:hypothetical protein
MPARKHNMPPKPVTIYLLAISPGYMHSDRSECRILVGVVVCGTERFPLALYTTRDRGRDTSTLQG